MSEEQREHICKRIDNLTRRGLLADWGYAVPIAPSPSESLLPATVNNPELPTTHSPSPSVVDKPLPVVNGVPITGPSNPPTSPIEPPSAQDTECVSYVPVMGVGSHNLGTKLILVSELSPSNNIALLTGNSSPKDDLHYTIDTSPLYRTVSMSKLINHLVLF